MSPFYGPTSSSTRSGTDPGMVHLVHVHPQSSGRVLRNFYKNFIKKILDNMYKDVDRSFQLRAGISGITCKNTVTDCSNMQLKRFMKL